MDANHSSSALTPGTRIRHARGWAGTVFAVDDDRVGVTPDDDTDAHLWPRAADCTLVAPALPRYVDAVRDSITAPLTAAAWGELAADLRAEVAAMWRAEGPEAEATIAARNRARTDCLRRRNDLLARPVYGALAIDHPEKIGTGRPEVTRWNAEVR